MSDPAEQEKLNRATVWLLEYLFDGIQGEPCNRCGHGSDVHRLDDSKAGDPTDPQAEFRCIWPMPAGPPVQLCDCPQFVPGSTAHG